jgi:hypothetical protein
MFDVAEEWSLRFRGFKDCVLVRSLGKNKANIPLRPTLFILP